MKTAYSVDYERKSLVELYLCNFGRKHYFRRHSRQHFYQCFLCPAITMVCTMVQRCAHKFQDTQEAMLHHFKALVVFLLISNPSVCAVRRILSSGKSGKASGKSGGTARGKSNDYNLQLLDPEVAKDEIFPSIRATIPCASFDETMDTILQVFYQNKVTRESLIFAQIINDCSPDLPPGVEPEIDIVKNAEEVADAIIEMYPQGFSNMTYFFSVRSTLGQSNRRSLETDFFSSKFASCSQQSSTTDLDLLLLDLPTPPSPPVALPPPISPPTLPPAIPFASPTGGFFAELTPAPVAPTTKRPTVAPTPAPTPVRCFTPCKENEECRLVPVYNGLEVSKGNITRRTPIEQEKKCFDKNIPLNIGAACDEHRDCKTYYCRDDVCKARDECTGLNGFHKLGLSCTSTHQCMCNDSGPKTTICGVNSKTATTTTCIVNDDRVLDSVPNEGPWY